MLFSQNPLSVLGTKDYITLPFQYSQGFIVVDVVFGYLFPMRFILDTGAEHTILLHKEYTDILNYSYDKEINVIGADISYLLKAWVVRKVPLQFSEGERIMKDIIVLENNILDLSAMTGLNIHGILGVEFLKNYIVDINYKEKVIRLYKSDYSRHQWRKYEPLPLAIYQHKPYLSCAVSLSGKTESEKLFLLDTGAALSLLLHTDIDSLSALPSNIIKGTIGKGIGGEIVGYSGKIDRFRFGKTNFENLVTSFQAPDSWLDEDEIIREGIIGNYLLDQFRVVFDFPASKLLLKPLKRKLKPLSYDKSGLIIYAFGKDFRNYYIHHVIPGSPAAEAGILKGDVLTHLGIWPSRFYSLNGINNKFSGRDKDVTLTITRSGIKKQVRFTLRDMYEKGR